MNIWDDFELIFGIEKANLFIGSIHYMFTYAIIAIFMIKEYFSNKSFYVKIPIVYCVVIVVILFVNLHSPQSMSITKTLQINSVFDIFLFIMLTIYSYGIIRHIKRK